MRPVKRRLLLLGLGLGLGLSATALAGCPSTAAQPGDAGVTDAPAADAVSCAGVAAVWRASPANSPVFSIADGVLRVSTTSLPPGCDPFLHRECAALAEIAQGNLNGNFEVRLRLRIVKADNPGGYLRFFVRDVAQPSMVADLFAGTSPRTQQCAQGMIGDCTFTAGADAGVADDGGVSGGCAGECRPLSATNEIELRLHREAGEISSSFYLDGHLDASSSPVPFTDDALEVGVALVNAETTVTGGETTFEVDDLTVVSVNGSTPGVSSDAFDCNTLE